MRKYIGLILFLAGVGAIPAISQKAPANQAESDGIKVVAFSTTYWNKDIPRYAPHFMILYWMWDGYIFAGPIKQQLEENFPIEKLKALIDK